jgi:enterochelin esterase-like enzyme
MWRFTVLVVVACSSPSPDRPPPSTPPPAARDKPAAESLVVGKAIDKPIEGNAHRYRIELGAGMVATGVATQKGVDLVVVTFDSSGKQLHEFDSPNGNAGPEPFHLEAKVAGSYDLEVRPFVPPPTDAVAAPAAGSAAPAAKAEGSYELRLEAIMTASDYAVKVAKQRIDSPRILELWRAVNDRRAGAVDKFWTELKDKSPFVEPYPGDPASVLITFVMRSKSPYVGLIGGPAFREQPMLRIGDSDLWYATARIPAQSYFGYAFIVTDGPPELHVPFQPREMRFVDPRFAKRLADPNNPKQQFGLSRVEIPAAPEQPFTVAKPEVPKGKLTELTLDSAALSEKRRIGVYTPAGYDPKGRYPLVIAFDGETYGLVAASALLPLPTILDNLIAAKKIPPTVAVLVDQQGQRNRDLTGSPAFTAFLVKELIPKLRAEFHAGLTPAQTLVTGSSFGGLCSAYTALHHPDVVGNVLANSGAYGYRNGAVSSDVSEYVEGGEVIRGFAKSPKLPIRFYVDAGLYEGDLLASNRHLRDVLTAKGYELTYAEFPGAHEYLMWRGTISDGLIALLGKK